MTVLPLPHSLPCAAYEAAKRAVDLAYWDGSLDELTAIVRAVDPISRTEEINRILKIIERVLETDSCREGLQMLMAALEARRAELTPDV